DLVGRKHSRHSRGRFGDDERQIALRSLVGAFAGAKPLDVAKHAAREEPARSDNRAANFTKTQLHVAAQCMNARAQRKWFGGLFGARTAMSAWIHNTNQSSGLLTQVPMSPNVQRQQPNSQRQNLSSSRGQRCQRY